MGLWWGWNLEQCEGIKWGNNHGSANTDSPERWRKIWKNNYPTSVFYFSNSCRDSFVPMYDSSCTNQCTYTIKKHSNPLNPAAVLEWNVQGEKVLLLVANIHNKHSWAKLCAVNDCWHLLVEYFTGRDCKLWGQDLKDACWQAVKWCKAGLQS